ncbi:MAG: lamin tail domain-containing protein [Candidatus Paceibacterota bacterium]|jgi:predicted ribosomally synthesized peptide with SipW-like signal peptide
MKKKTDKKIISRKAKAVKTRKRSSRSSVAPKKMVSRRIRVVYEEYSKERKDAKVLISFVIPVRILKTESRAALSSCYRSFRKEISGKRFLNKIVASFLIVAINWFSIISIVGTDAYFNDVETSQNNQFSAAQLDFSLSIMMSDGFRTQTQGGWGNGGNEDCVDADSEGQNGKGHGGGNCINGAVGDNPGDYRDEHFNEVFVNGLTVGDEASGYFAHFSTSEAIRDFLPAGKTPGAFTEDHEDPPETEAGVLAGQVVSLALNMGFDEFDPDFGINEGKLEELHASDLGIPCEKMAVGEGMTVGEILAEANLVLSGQTDRFTPEEMNDCVSEINEKFDNGDSVKITPAVSVWRDTVIIKHEGLNFLHGIKAEEASGDADLCEKLTVEAYLNGVLMYSGNLVSFDYKSSVFSDSANEWRFLIGLPADAPDSLAGKTCTMKYIVSGWQENISIPGGGFSDVEEVSDTVGSGEWVSSGEESGEECSDHEDGGCSSGDDEKPEEKKDHEENNEGEEDPEDNGPGSVVMNEFLPNPDGEEYGSDFGKDKDHMPKGEWIELYNTGNSDLDLAGWYFQDADQNTVEITGSNTLESTIIPAHGWLVVYMNGAILDNRGDETIIFYNDKNDVIDSYSYSGGGGCDLEPTPGSINGESASDDCSVVPGNKSYARIPDGTGSWFDPIPTPGKSNETPENLASTESYSNGLAEVQSSDVAGEESAMIPQEGSSGEGAVAEADQGIAGETIGDPNTGNDILITESPDSSSDAAGGVDASSEAVPGTIGDEEADVGDVVALVDPAPSNDVNGENGDPEDGGKTIQAVNPKDVVAGGESQGVVEGDAGI